MKIKAKNLILDLLLATPGQCLPAREAITSCALFGISENSARVTLARLTAEGLIEAAERGLYRLSAKAHELADEVATWRSAEQRVRDWNGGYLVVHIGPLKKGDRSLVRRRQRALDMLGFRGLEPGLLLRPDNIEDSIGAVRKRLIALGLEREAAVFIAQDFDATRSARIKRLWDGKALNAAYRNLGKQLNAWLARAHLLEPEAAARESFLLGGKAIRQVVFDPLLPSPMVDAEARHAFVETVRRFDAAGQAIWRRLRLPLDTSSFLEPKRSARAQARATIEKAP